ncbi:GNAT family N-acetyltransferase [Pseudomonas chlororaphis]|uniref:GNAT family N-acetyltransferase n=1 Tax=Pseudomonas chlororaphis TaxID=587753 RepID=UPI0023674901|nr:GNAT family N-acetyltransferase [Pseudomonas chlororaphis]WDH32368.1 GNAT family N-acetyltransferase [Pseudomonas chlororaphis]WDH38452.1 GNAT family N-acetyltransferase [Pseudomonas chlororaphis]
MIRLARPTDAPAIAQVQIRSWQQAYPGLMPDDYLASLDNTQEQRQGWWRQSIERGSPEVFVALVDDRIIGWIAVGGSRDEDVDPGTTAEVMAFYLLAEHWRRGIGRALWTTAVEHLRGQGFQALSLWVLLDNTRATGFYRNAGLRADNRSRRSISRGGRTLEEIRYRATL